MFVCNNFLGQTVSFGICQGVAFSHEKIYCLESSKQPRPTTSPLLSIGVFQPHFAQSPVTWTGKPMFFPALSYQEKITLSQKGLMK